MNLSEKEISLEEIHEIELGIMDYVHKICEENQIKLDLTDYPESVQIHVSTCYFQSYECQSYLTFYIGELLV